MPQTPTFAPPYYAVIFSSKRIVGNTGYSEMAERMETLAKTMPGYLGMESVSDPDGFAITVSYWESEEAIAGWKENAEHQEAQRMGRAEWYESFDLRVARVERAYGMKKAR